MPSASGRRWALMVAQLVLGVMNVGAMALVVGVIAAEKPLSRGVLVAPPSASWRLPPARA